MRATLRLPAWLSALPVAVLLGSLAPALAQPYRPAFRPETLKASSDREPNRVVVLGTTHLSGLPKNFSAAWLEPLLDRLAAWRPTAIATENLSGLQCDAMRRYPVRYAQTVEDYCFDPAAAGRATGLDVPAANAEAERLLATWPSAPTPAQRRHLAAIFLAAGEPGSALVQWLRLGGGERRAGDGLNQDLVDLLNSDTTRQNETYLISAPLAARLGLERLYSVDDHTADTPDGPDPATAKAFGDALTKAWDNDASRQRQAEDARRQQKLGQPGALLDMYRALNAPDQGMLIYRSDFGAALTEPSSQQFGRMYLGGWETRNLRMVANMRDVMGQHPGMRLLAIVGVSHKAYYEAYLNQMHDVTLVDVETVLR